MIPANVRVREAQVVGEPVRLYDPKVTRTAAYPDLTESSGKVHEGQSSEEQEVRRTDEGARTGRRT